ncbi:MAG TPA: hypothetical protein VM240_01445 [Verrucomicrobiae bacterium]|nr:hypothetical protein [Verrucomicrobiae bacterium]
MKAPAIKPALVLLLAFLGGCESIGEGSTIESLSIEAGNSRHNTTPFLLQRCLRDQLVVVATFTDGTRADFSLRARWVSSDPSVVQVSNNDIPTAAVISGAFTTIPTLPYRPGTIIPQASSGTATITASYIGLTASKTVQIESPLLRIAPVTPGASPNGVQPTQFLAPKTTLGYAFLSERVSGEVESQSTLNLLGPLNPVLWKVRGVLPGEFDARDTTIAGDFDKYAAPTAADPSVVISSITGLVTGMKADTATYTVEASTSLCPNEQVSAPVSVAAFASPALTLEYEPAFNGVGVIENGETIAGTSQALVVTGNLDTDGNTATAEQSMDLSNQADLRITPTGNLCTAGTTNCTCDADGISNCRKRLFSSVNSQVFTLITDDGAMADVQACFTDIDASHSDDCEEIDAGPGTNVAVQSNTLAVKSIPIDLSGATGSFTVQSNVAQEPAFTYPGAQFTAYGTFTALTGFAFAGGPTAMQNFTRIANWITRPAGVTDQFSDVAVIRNSSDGLFNPAGSMTYLKDVTTNTNIDVSFVLRAPFAEIDPPAAVPFTVCPSAGC